MSENLTISNPQDCHNSHASQDCNECNQHGSINPQNPELCVPKTSFAKQLSLVLFGFYV